MYYPPEGTTDEEFEIGERRYHSILFDVKRIAREHLDCCAECRRHLLPLPESHLIKFIKELYYHPLVVPYRSGEWRVQHITIGLTECKEIAEELQREFARKTPLYLLSYFGSNTEDSVLKFRNREILIWFLEDQQWDAEQCTILALQPDGGYLPVALP